MTLMKWVRCGRMLGSVCDRFEFAGPEPSQRVLDALVLYIEDIDFLPNRR